VGTGDKESLFLGNWSYFVLDVLEGLHRAMYPSCVCAPGTLPNLEMIVCDFYHYQAGMEILYIASRMAYGVAEVFGSDLPEICRGCNWRFNS
jgi:hypothetical protein